MSVRAEKDPWKGPFKTLDTLLNLIVAGGERNLVIEVEKLDTLALRAPFELKINAALAENIAQIPIEAAGRNGPLAHNFPDGGG